MNKPKIAIVIPCFNEERSIDAVVNSFKKILPEANIFVYDNGSNDNTTSVALNAGAIVRNEPNRGKGNVIKRAFLDVDADIYVMVDGDATYDISQVDNLIEILISENLDMISGYRISDNLKGEYRPGHVFGNWLLSKTVSTIFGKGFKDMLSGYRVMSKRFVKSFPILSKGFEIETEMTIHCLQLGIAFKELPVQYYPRKNGSQSKLKTYSDGFRILGLIFRLYKDEKPLQFFLSISILLFLVSIVIAIPIFSTFIETGLVPRLPTAVLATGLMILSFLSLASGLILDGISKTRSEIKKLSYLKY